MCPARTLRLLQAYAFGESMPPRRSRWTDDRCGAMIRHVRTSHKADTPIQDPQTTAADRFHARGGGASGGGAGTPVSVFPSSEQASQAVAREIADRVRDKARRGERAVLGLTTGSTPTGVYEELVRLHRDPGMWLRVLNTFAVGVEGLDHLTRESFKNHSMERYVELLEQVRRREAQA
jgi:hypothetical protein